MKHNLHIAALLFTTLTIIGMKKPLCKEPQCTLLSLAKDTLVKIIVMLDGRAKNQLALTCKPFNFIAAFCNKDHLLLQPGIGLGPIEKHLLLLEYAQQDNVEMFKRMITLGARYDTISSVFGTWHDKYQSSDDHSEDIYIPHEALFPPNRRPTACIDLHQTILHVAAIHNCIKIAALILNDFEQKTPSDTATLNKKKSCFFVEKTAAIWSKDSTDETTFSQEYYSYINELKAYNTASNFINRSDTNGATALHLAAQHNNPAILQLLVAIKKITVRYTTKNLQEKTALDIARANGHAQIEQPLRAAQNTQ